MVALAGSLLACGSEAPPPPVEPIVPADYATTFTVVRDCRQSIDHDLSHIRVLASPTGADAYATASYPLPAGTLLVKEEHDDTGCGSLARLSAMQKRGETWWFQRLDAARVVLEDNTPRCAACHEGCTNGRDMTCTDP